MCDFIKFDADLSNGEEANKIHSPVNKELNHSNSRIWTDDQQIIIQNKHIPQIISERTLRDNHLKYNKIIVPIDALEKPTIDAVLNSVSLVYDPFTKQLHLKDDQVETKNGIKHNCVENLKHVRQMGNDNDNHNDNQNKIENNCCSECCEEDNFSIENGHNNHELSIDTSSSESESKSLTNGHIESNGQIIDGSSCSESENDTKIKKIFSLSLNNILSKVKRKNGIVTVASSTSGLILENRPPHLPAKTEEEEKKHKLEYEELIKEAKKREIREEKMKKKIIQKQQKQEELVIESIKLWVNEILPNWNKVKDSKKTREIWWKGIPSCVREHVWSLAIGNELNISNQLYEICVRRSKEKIWTKENCDGNGESAADLIKLDVSRTFPQLGLFQENGPYNQALRTLLGAYVTHRPDIGYVQGMSFLAAMLLLNMDHRYAFISFANLINNQLLLSFFRVDQTLMNAYYQSYEEFFKENLPKLYNHFSKNNLTPDLYLVDYIYTLFSRSLPLDISSRIWDLFLRDGDELLFRAALGILSMYQDALLQLDFINLAQFLTKLPDDINSETLFTAISNIKMIVGNEKLDFSTILMSIIENLTTSR